MIGKDDILAKCQTFSELRPLKGVIAPREFNQAELEAIDFVIETFITLKETISTIADTTLAKLQIWLASTKDTGSHI